MDPMKKNALRGFIADICVVAFALIGMILQFLSSHPWWGAFRFYALVSSLLLLPACSLQAAFEGRILRDKGFFVPSFVHICKYAASCCAAVTFLAALSVTAPLSGGIRSVPDVMFRLPGLFLRLFCPVLAVVSYIFIDQTALPDRRVTILPLIPFGLYALIIILLNLTRTIRGPYPFLLLYEQPVWLSILWLVLLFTLVETVSLLIWKYTLRYRMMEEPVELRKDTEAWTEDGFLKDQDALTGITYRTISACHNGCGPIAAFDVQKYAGQEPDLEDVFRKMDRLHLLCLPGPTFVYVMRRYFRRTLPGFREITGKEPAIRAAEKSRMGVFRYHEQKVPHFVAYCRTEQGFRFFNVSDGKEDVIMTMEDFAKDHLLDGPVRLFCWE